MHYRTSRQALWHRLPKSPCRLIRTLWRKFATSIHFFPILTAFASGPCACSSGDCATAEPVASYDENWRGFYDSKRHSVQHADRRPLKIFHNDTDHFSVDDTGENYSRLTGQRVVLCARGNRGQHRSTAHDQPRHRCHELPDHFHVIGPRFVHLPEKVPVRLLHRPHFIERVAGIERSALHDIKDVRGLVNVLKRVTV